MPSTRVQINMKKGGRSVQLPGSGTTITPDTRTYPESLSYRPTLIVGSPHRRLRTRAFLVWNLVACA